MAKQSGGSLSGLKASTKRVGPVDPKGAWTKVQKNTLAGAKGKAVLKKDKELGATKMSKKKQYEKDDEESRKWCYYKRS